MEISPEQEVAKLREELFVALLQKHESEQALKRCNDQILSIRNALGGVELGQRLETENGQSEKKDK